MTGRRKHGGSDHRHPLCGHHQYGGHRGRREGNAAEQPGDRHGEDAHCQLQRVRRLVAQLLIDHINEKREALKLRPMMYEEMRAAAS